MKVVADVVVGADAGRMVRIAHCRVEIDHGVERTAASNPGVHRLALHFSRRLV
jgi:hypothetical protein